MNTLQAKLKQLDGKSYRSLKDIQGTYHAENYTLHVDYVQGDPFATPSRVRFFISSNHVDLTFDKFDNLQKETALTHFFAHECHRQILNTKNPVHGTGKSGLISIDRPGQEVLQRTAVTIDEGGIEFRLSTGLPAQGRRILGQKAATLLSSVIPNVVLNTVRNYDREKLNQALLLAEDQAYIRKELFKRNLVSFIANGSRLPRESGVSNKPLMDESVIMFQSPREYETTINLPSGKSKTGMGIKKGISLIIGGGYHGKSTLLQAMERGVYNHQLEDGREYVITDEDAVKIRSEDGRAVTKVNISPFINDLPFGKKTTSFSSEDASGSTSQSANIIEALEMDASLLLIDEDTSATNFMIRDGRMQKLVSKSKEPITPFIDRVQQLFKERGVSTVLVLGGSGDYFDVADHIIMMDDYKPFDRTKEAKFLADTIKSTREKEVSNKEAFYSAHEERKLELQKIRKLFDRKEKVEAKGLHSIRIGNSNLALHHVEQLVDSSQTQAIAHMVKRVANVANGETSLKKAIDKVYEEITRDGLDSLSPFKGKHPGDFALPRKLEVASAFNRIRY
ncbi:ATPase [Salipaludibacillus neizhouensis]|uniref:ATPase n=1 Tax=Salipaludibacillus neizhouensis TaxID=885475 RepID=A0A3A9K4E5_9BACI|nr:ABC-ATPase domain-containing protein [Salipaludibacillus neizhouensis]RKL67507.1 ATPase [Salipaludibacillus neizhouensis]